MSDDVYNLCACYLNYFRQSASQDICSQTQCYVPNTFSGSNDSSDPENYMFYFMVTMAGLALYMLRPKSLREDGGKGADIDSDFDGEPPHPPPSVN